MRELQLKRCFNAPMMFLCSAALALLIVACNRPRVEDDEQYSNQEDVDSMAYMDEKIALGDGLQQVRDEIDTLMNKASRQKQQGDAAANGKLEEAIRELGLNRIKIEREMQEVQTTSSASWKPEYVERIRTTMEEVRKDIQQIKEEAGIE
jgi:hypothetical protein